MNPTSKFKGWHRVLLIIIPYILVIVICQLLGMLVSGMSISGQSESPSTLQEVIITFCTLSGALLLIWVFRKWIDKEPFADIGLLVKNRGKDILYGMLIGFLIMALGFGLLLLLKEIEIQDIDFQPTELMLNLTLFIFVAVGEESLMRGYVLNNLMLSMNKYMALLISALAFSLLHLANPHFSPITFVVILLSGIILGLSYLYTRNLWFPFALHFSWNFFQGTIFGFNVSGQDDYSLIVQLRNSDNLINGGPFGFEGSLLSIGLLLLFTAVVWKIYYRKDIAKKPIFI